MSTKLQSKKNTFVPAPVILIEPSKIDTHILTPGVDQINFKISNVGFIRANGLILTLPPVDGLQFVPLLDRPIGDLDANTIIYHPVKVEADDRR